MEEQKGAPAASPSVERRRGGSQFTGETWLGGKLWGLREVEGQKESACRG